MTSIEFGHLYANEEVGEEQEAAQSILTRMTGRGEVPGHRELLVLVDDYNVEASWDARALANRLAHTGPEPDLIFSEADLADAGTRLLNQLTGREAKSLRRWTAKNGQVPCVVLTAAWYLMRLGLYPSPVDRLHGRPLQGCSHLLNLLPEVYRDVEDRAVDLVAQVMGGRPPIRTVYFETPDPWDHFQPEAYWRENYRDVKDVDRALGKFLREEWESIGQVEALLEVGTGPNLYPAVAGVGYAANMLLLDYSTRNVTWLREEVEHLAVSDRDWLAFGSSRLGLQEVARELPLSAAVGRGSIYTLEGTWPVIQTFFVAESITDRLAEFQRAILEVHDHLSPGGHYLAAFMLGWDGYTVAGSRFPALALQEEDVLDILRHTGFDVERSTTPLGEPVRDGYSGMLFVHARRPQDG